MPSSFNEIFLISNGNRTEWSPIRSVIKRVMRESDLFNHEFFASNEKKPFRRARDGAYCPIT